MRKYEKRLVKTLADIVCDMCNKSCQKPQDSFEYGTLTAAWGYFSQHDEETIRLDLCEECFYSIMAFIKPQLDTTRAARDQSSSN